MPGLYKDEAIVLKTMKLGEADRIVTLLTREHGKVRAVAKGIRKTKSRFGGRLEPLTRVDLMLYRGRDLDTITAAQIITSFDDLRTDYSMLASAAALVEAVEKITPDRERSFSVYALLLGGLQALADGKGDSVVPAFLVKLLSLSGYHPQLTLCAGCGTTIALDGFSPAMGGAVCRLCGQEDPDSFQVSGDTIVFLASLLAGEYGLQSDRERAFESLQTLRRYAEYHIERPLRSLHLLIAS
ncbi:MAG: DNA repair protein RecO [Actinomycetota bacterium]|nr:DNA repair protein RecO [Actinomycetota bacterium]